MHLLSFINIMRLFSLRANPYWAFSLCLLICKGNPRPNLALSCFYDSTRFDCFMNYGILCRSLDSSSLLKTRSVAFIKDPYRSLSNLFNSD